MDETTVRKIAKLARLQLQDDEVAHFATELGGIIKWIEQLSEVDTKGVDDVADWAGAVRFRADEVTDGDCREAVLANAPAAEFDCFVVPKVIE